MMPPMWSKCQKFVRAQEQLGLNWAWKVSIIYTWLMKTLRSVLSSFILSLVFFLPLALLASTVHWLCCSLFLSATNSQLRSVLDSTKHVHCGGPPALYYPSSIVKKHHSFLSSIASTRHPCMSVYVTRVPERAFERKLTLEHDRHCTNACTLQE